MRLGKAYLGRLVETLEDAFGQQDCTLAFGLMRLVQASLHSWPCV